MDTWHKIQFEFEQDFTNMDSDALVAKYKALLNKTKLLSQTHAIHNTLEAEFGLFEVKELAYLAYIPHYKEKYLATNNQVFKKFLQLLQIKYNEFFRKSGSVINSDKKKIEYINVIILLEVILEEFCVNFDDSKKAVLHQYLSDFKTKTSDLGQVYDYKDVIPSKIAHGFAKFLVNRGFNYKALI